MTKDPRTMGLLVSDMNTIGPRTMGGRGLEQWACWFQIWTQYRPSNNGPVDFRSCIKQWNHVTQILHQTIEPRDPDFNTIALSISDFTTIALGLTPNVRCSAARHGERAAGGRDTTIASWHNGLAHYMRGVGGAGPAAVVKVSVWS